MFTWRYLDKSGEERRRSQRFADKDAAETWLGTAWQDLVAQGFVEVALHDDDRGTRLYRMGLKEA